MVTPRTIRSIIVSTKLAAQDVHHPRIHKTEKDLAESLVKLHRIGYPAVQAVCLWALWMEIIRRYRHLIPQNDGGQWYQCIATHEGGKSLASKTDTEIESITNRL